MAAKISSTRCRRIRVQGIRICQRSTLLDRHLESLVKRQRQEVHAKAKHRATLAIKLRLERGGMAVA
jgi:hypothetical protein